MLKYIFCFLITACVVSVVGLNCYQRYLHNAHVKDLAQYSSPVEFNADLGNVLVLYYSLDSYTQDIATRIATITHGKAVPIKILDTYSKPLVYWKSKKQLENKLYPHLEEIPNLKDYHTIFVGGPVWWYTMAPPLYSLLNELDFGGRRVVPFSTQSSNFGTFFTDFSTHVKNANLLIPEIFYNISGNFDDELNNKIITWVNKLSYPHQDE